MCGRIEINKNIVDKGVYATQNVRFDAVNNLDQRPSQLVSCLHHHHGKVEQVNSHWGIKPGWAKHAIINAQSETVAVKKTFSSAYALHRCVVPCSAWFEWTGERGHRTKHRFFPYLEPIMNTAQRTEASSVGSDVLFMAGILLPDKQRNYELVTLTTGADSVCSAYHHRMPLLIDAAKVNDWLALPQAAHELKSFHDHHSIGVAPPSNAFNPSADAPQF